MSTFSRMKHLRNRHQQKLHPAVVAVCFLCVMIFAAVAHATTLRIVSYNIDCADKGSDGNITNATRSLPTVVQAIGLHHLGTNVQQVDVIGCEELLSTTLS